MASHVGFDEFHIRVEAVALQLLAVRCSGPVYSEPSKGTQDLGTPRGTPPKRSHPQSMDWSSLWSPGQMQRQTEQEFGCRVYGLGFRVSGVCVKGMLVPLTGVDLCQVHPPHAPQAAGVIGD